MLTKVIERPPAYSFSKNELRYVFRTQNLLAPNLYVQVQLYSRINRGSSFLSWKLEQVQGGTYIDANLEIRVNGIAVVEEAWINTGVISFNAGDSVAITLPIADPWPVTGNPYAKLIVKDGETELFNNYSTDSSPAGWLTFTFVADANKQYSVNAYTRDEADLPHTEDLEMPVINPYTLQKVFNLKPQNDGRTYLYIGDRIDSLLEYVLPSMNSVAKNASEQTATIYIRFREVSDWEPNNDWVETEVEKKRIVLKGGIEKEVASRNNYFNYRDIQKSFFTWMPNNRFVFADERVFLGVQHSGAADKLHITVGKMDGTEVSHDIDLDLSKGVFWHLNVSPAILELNTIAGGDPIRYYEVSLLDDADVAVCNPHRFYIEYRPSYRLTDMIFHNSLGAAECVRVRGEVDWTIERDFQETEGFMNINDAASEFKMGDTGDSYISKRDTYKSDVGFLRTADNKMKRLQEALTELLVSTSIFQYRDGRWVRIRIVQKSIAFRAAGDKKFSFPIEWQLAFDNPVFTPKDVNLGIADDTEVYP